MPIDLAAVDWAYVGVLTAFAFIAALLGSLISFRNRFAGAILAAILFAVAFLFWTYYPHENIPGPTRLSPVVPSVVPAPAPMSPPAR